MNDNLISIAKILNFHGIKGEVKLGYTKGAENRIAQLQKFALEKDGALKELNAVSIRFHKGAAIVKFKEFNSINDTAEYKGCILYAPREKIEESIGSRRITKNTKVHSRLGKCEVENKTFKIP